MGFVHRIYRACSDWNAFHESLERAKKILQKNQYPEVFYEPIISETLTKIIQKDSNEESVLNLSDISSSAEAESVTQNNDIDLNEAIHSIEDKDKFRLFVEKSHWWVGTETTPKYTFRKLSYKARSTLMARSGELPFVSKTNYDF